uniref:ATP synthase F0 subunit 8 n=2 Tax=Stichopodidae TaxID=7687 RepID=A0A6M4RGM9_9ECHN|nr:ATP synthase F0 subunit 8 [Stichopus horrens]QXG82912.1 ATP synthase F0 subunit 8 [Isostichopus badionotus]
MPQLDLLWFLLNFLLAWSLVIFFSFSLLKQNWFSYDSTDNSEEVNNNNKNEQTQQEWQW